MWHRFQNIKIYFSNFKYWRKTGIKLWIFHSSTVICLSAVLWKFSAYLCRNRRTNLQIKMFKFLVIFHEVMSKRGYNLSIARKLCNWGWGLKRLMAVRNWENGDVVLHESRAQPRASCPVVWHWLKKFTTSEALFPRLPCCLPEVLLSRRCNLAFTIYISAQRNCRSTKEFVYCTSNTCRALNPLLLSCNLSCMQGVGD